MKNKKKLKFFSLLGVLTVFLGVLSGCSAYFRGNLSSEEKFYLQNEDGTVSETQVDSSRNILTQVDPSVTVGGYIESPVNGKTFYWVPKYMESTDGPLEFYYDMDTDVGRPTKVPAAASVNDLIINPMNPNQVLVSINVQDQNHQNVDGYTHVYVSEASPKNNVSFYDFDHVNGYNEPIPLLESAPPAGDTYQGWKSADSASTIFGYYHVDSSFFEKFQTAYNDSDADQKPVINSLLNRLGENTDSPKDGVVDVFSTINEDVWNKGSFSLDLKTGTTPFASLNVILPKLTAVPTESGTVQLSWPKVFGNVSGYHLYQDGEPIAQVGNDVTTYEVKGLTVGNTYKFSVKGIFENNVDSLLELSSTQLIKDVKAPVITLNGDNPMTIEKGTAYTEPGFSAVDNIDGDVTNQVTVTGQVDVDRIGDYPVVYQVKDSAGNEAEVTRTVHVVDKNAPVITIKGDNPLTIVQGSTFNDPGVTAIDDVDGDLTDKVTVTGKVDVNTPGEYQLVYTISDAAGNKAEATRIVKVKAKGAPAPQKGDNGGGKAPQKEHQTLPDTGSNQYNWLLAGAILVAAGVLMFLIRVKRKNHAGFTER